MHCASSQFALRRQRGYTLLLILLVLLVGGTSVYLTARDPGAGTKAAEASGKARLLNEAREAVIAYAVLGGANNRPGAVPCPDFDGDGTVDGNCLSGSDPHYLERLPWRTLELSPNHEHLWYAIDGDFRDDSGAEPINVAVEGSLVLNGESGYAALLIVPGDPLAGQAGRPSGDPSDYLENENADGDEEFVDCADVDECNDRIAGIRVDPLFEIVQQRVLAEIEQELRAFHDGQGFMPFAAPFMEAECSDGNLLGRIATEPGDCTGADPVLQESDFSVWIMENEWLDHVVYRVAEECTQGQSGCTGANLQLEDDSGLAVVLGAAGTVLNGQERTGVNPDIADFLDSDENIDGDRTFDDVPPSPTDNDILRGFALP